MVFLMCLPRLPLPCPPMPMKPMLRRLLGLSWSPRRMFGTSVRAAAPVDCRRKSRRFMRLLPRSLRGAIGDIVPHRSEKGQSLLPDEALPVLALFPFCPPPDRITVRGFMSQPERDTHGPEQPLRGGLRG